MLPVDFDNLENAGLDPIDHKKTEIPTHLDEVPVPPKPDGPKLGVDDIANIVKGVATQKALEYLGAEPSTGNLGIIIAFGVVILIIVLSLFS